MDEIMLLDEIEELVYIADIETYDILYLNKSAKRRLGEKNTGKKCYEAWCNKSQPCEYCKKDASKEDSFQTRQFHNDKYNTDYILKDKLIKYKNRTCRLQIAIDITENVKYQQKMKEIFFHAAKQSGMCAWLYDINSSSIIASINSFYKLDKEICVQDFPKCVEESGKIHPDDYKEFEKLHKKIKSGVKTAYSTSRWRASNDSEWRYKKISYTVLFDENNIPYQAIGAAVDVTEMVLAEKRYSNEHDYRENMESSMLLSSAKVNVSQDRVIQFFDSDITKSQIAENINYTRVIYELAQYIPDDKEKKTFLSLLTPRNLIRAYENGERNLDCDYRREVHNKIEWTRISVNITKDSDTDDIIGYMYTKNINDVKVIQSIMEGTIKNDYDFIMLINGMNSDFITFKNETTNAFLPPYKGEDYSKAIESFVNMCVEPKQKAALIKDLQIENMAFKLLCNKDCCIHFDAVSKDGASCKKTLRFYYLDSKFKQIILSVTDTTELYKKEQHQSTMLSEVLQQAREANNILSNVMANEFDMVAYVDVANDRCKIYDYSLKNTDTGTKLNVCYSQENKRRIEEYVDEEYKSTLTEKLDINYMVDRLNNLVDYYVYYKAIDTTGEMRRKKVHIFYADAATANVCIARTDITNDYEEEQKVNVLLKDALKMAEQANIAKSEFLSRMSHEMRTPMNAIIGLTAIATNETEDKEQLEDCLSKIGISARYLLSLINDILDMSKINSGKLTLNEDVFDFHSFISDINTIMEVAANEKNVGYEVAYFGNIEDKYIGDSLKLQQVLVNIISNAIKFTSSGGKVNFNIEQIKTNSKQSTLKFSISDTGCGIGEDFIDRVFEPFAQENQNLQTTYNGSGLGLSICKNIVELMGGTITVHSIKGIGSEFVVQISLKCIKNPSNSSNSKRINQLKGKKILVVDNDMAACQHAVLLLNGAGAITKFTDNAASAISLVKNESFDVYIVNGNLTDTDSIKAIRLLRLKKGNCPIVIMTTDLNSKQVAASAKIAGVDSVVEKPMLLSTILSGYENAVLNKKTKGSENEFVEYDFTKMRVLIVDDHVLNTQIAKKLLEAKGCTVESAENGLEALELYASKESEYYDAIFMDVSMPVMDGLSACMNIRKMKKPGSKTIPIIAMTANAFEEDAEKSIAAGMNAHLTKPIDPSKLYEVLASLIF